LRHAWRTRNERTGFQRIPEGKRSQGRDVSVWDDNIKMDLKETIFVLHLNLLLKTGENREVLERQIRSFE